MCMYISYVYILDTCCAYMCPPQIIYTYIHIYMYILTYRDMSTPKVFALKRRETGPIKHVVSRADVGLIWP